MVKFAGSDKTLDKFVCAAGVLTHYVGDACQPLHISYLHDGDPLKGTRHTVHHHDGTTSDVMKAAGMGVHSAYEDAMVNSHRKSILSALDKTRPVQKTDYVGSGQEAAALVIRLMSDTFARIPPHDIVKAYLKLSDKKSSGTELWKAFGKDTMDVMQDGVRTLAILWESAWDLAQAEARKPSGPTLTGKQAMAICARDTFLPSCGIDKIKPYLKP